MTTAEDGTRARSRPWRTILWIVVLAFVLFHVAGAVVFSNMIFDDALTPRPPTPDFGVFVRSVESDSITLTSPDVREDTTRPGVAALVWNGGFGRIGRIRTIDGPTVTRDFMLIEGNSPPTCNDEPVACEEVDIDPWTYPADPGDRDLPFMEVRYASPLGEMGAWRVDAGDGDVWAIHAHGWRAGRREALRTLPIYAELGITSLVIDYRNDPDAPADPSEIYRFGRSEWEDVEGAVGYALAEGAEAVVLVGYSTGAALDLAFLEESPLAGDVDAAILESPNIDFAEAVRIEAARRSIPGTPLPVPATVTWAAMTLADLRWDVGWDDIDYVSRADRILQIPTLVLHGVEDSTVPIDVSRRLKEVEPDRVQLVEFPEAGHVTNWNVDRAKYEQTVETFLSETVAG